MLFIVSVFIVRASEIVSLTEFCVPLCEVQRAANRNMVIHVQKVNPSWKCETRSYDFMINLLLILLFTPIETSVVKNIL